MASNVFLSKQTKTVFVGDGRGPNFTKEGKGGVGGITDFDSTGGDRSAIAASTQRSGTRTAGSMVFGQEEYASGASRLVDAAEFDILPDPLCETDAIGDPSI